MQKIFNEHRRSYRDRVKKVLNLSMMREKSIKKSSLNRNAPKLSKGDNLQAAIVRYTDGCESLLSEAELLHLLQKRKTDPSWKKVACLKNFIGPISSNSSQF